jgi:hypothetical protein
VPVSRPGELLEQAATISSRNADKKRNIRMEVPPFTPAGLCQYSIRHREDRGRSPHIFAIQLRDG